MNRVLAIGALIGVVALILLIVLSSSSSKKSRSVTVIHTQTVTRTVKNRIIPPPANWRTLGICHGEPSCGGFITPGAP